jgi:hypothetical protein
VAVVLHFSFAINSQILHGFQSTTWPASHASITTHDLLVSTNRNTGGVSYERLEDRLAGTRIKTNVATGEETTTQNFGLIEWYDYSRKAHGLVERLKFLDIKL